MTQTSKLSQIYGFDILKLIMALFIVAIHSKPFEESPVLYSIFSPFMSVAVPLFFILSSFFLFRKLNSVGNEWGIMLQWMKRMGILYLFWLVINLPFVIHDRLAWSNESFPYLIWYFIRDLFFSHTFAGSWFLSALVLGVLGAFLIKKYLKSNLLLLLFAVLVEWFLHFRDGSLGLVNDVYSWLSINIREELELTPLMGIIWCNIGCVLASDLTIKYCNYLKDNKGISFLLLGAALFYILMIFNDSIYEFSKFSLVLSLFIIGYCVNLSHSPVYKLFRNYSILFYFLHFIWLRIYAHTLAPMVNGGGYKYLIIIALCAVSATLIIKLSDKKYFKWLKYSY